MDAHHFEITAILHKFSSCLAEISNALQAAIGQIVGCNVM